MCRRFSLDELPQLAHVVIGQMSLVGPRPITQAELLKYYGASAGEVTGILPGMTGLWQVMGRNRLNYRQRRRLDLFLVRHFSPGFYFQILLRTLPNVLLGSNAW
jgi:lipopolysaccharide/colanic/teichoic acid biosynthesis glycosyltransferase